VLLGIEAISRALYLSALLRPTSICIRPPVTLERLRRNPCLGLKQLIMPCQLRMPGALLLLSCGGLAESEMPLVRCKNFKSQRHSLKGLNVAVSISHLAVDYGQARVDIRMETKKKKRETTKAKMVKYRPTTNVTTCEEEDECYQEQWEVLFTATTHNCQTDHLAALGLCRL
jgi:hypothetical protein